jgi:hypothetical protein
MFRSNGPPPPSGWQNEPKQAVSRAGAVRSSQKSANFCRNTQRHISETLFIITAVIISNITCFGKLREHYGTSRKFAGSSSDEMDFFI